MKSEAQVVRSLAIDWGALARHWAAIAQLALAILVIYVYEIEGPAFARLMTLGGVGFVISLVLPISLRLRFFVALSLAGILLVLGPADGAWLLALGLVLIGLCHLPWRLAYRAAALIVAGVVFGALRAGAGDVPWSAAVWPILGSMFMFRTTLYVRAVAAGQAQKGLWGALAYFFMLPNVAFPLFPVVDYQTFHRTHFDKAESAIYEQGLLWIARGLVHLLLYRFVYHSVLNDPADVVHLSDLVQLMLGTFLLYLRVSGQFHLIIGVLHLFGFRLPETHKLYYLAHSFTELWRRINIYWTDFMMKVVFYPMYFKVKRMGPRAAVAIATAAVFATTWLLHSYQWFWLRGGFPLTGPDFLFWAILGALVVRGALRELQGGKGPKRSDGWSLSLGLKAARTFFIFCFLWSLWSSESVGHWLWTLSAAANVDARGVVWLIAIFVLITALGGRDWESARAQGGLGWWAWLRRPIVRTAAPLLLLLCLAQPAAMRTMPGPMAAAVGAMQTTGLNARDAALQHRGYYEQLDVRGQLNAAVLDDRVGRADWKDPAAAGIIRERQDRLSRDLYPSLRIQWNDMPFSTNSFGMRDREYEQSKPAGTLRIALLGPSHVMGNGVADGETFEQLVEDRLNQEFRRPHFERIEILNFGVDGYTLPQQLALLEDRVLAFEPDIVLITHYHRGRAMTERYLMKVVWQGIQLPDEPLRVLIEDAGLADARGSGPPVPFESLRALLKAAGVDARMPHGESEAKVRRIADAVNVWSIERIAEVARERGVKPVVLALNAVIDDAPERVPDQEVIDRARLPVIDLFDVFPADERQSLRVAPWDDHPNAEGHRRIAERLYVELLPLLETPLQEPGSATGANHPSTKNEVSQ